MAEYIDKHKAQMVLCMLPAELDAEAVQRCIEAVHNLPAADVVEVVHGKWVDIQPPDADRNVQCWCSVCGAGELHAENQIVPYCWKCGAKMDGGDHDADG